MSPKPTPPTPRRHPDASDPLAQFESRPAGSIAARGLVRPAAAVLLLGLGIGLAIWMATLIHAAVMRPEPPAVVRRMAATSPADLTVVIPAGKVELPPATMSFLSHLILILLLAVGAKLTLSLLRGGAALLRGEAGELAAKGPTAEAPERDA